MTPMCFKSALFNQESFAPYPAANCPNIYCFPQRSAALALPWQRVYQALKHGASFSPIPGLSFIGHVRQNPLRDRIDRHVPTQSCARRTCYTLESKRTDVQRASSGLLQIRCVSTWHRVSYCHGRTGFFSTPGVRHLPVGFFRRRSSSTRPTAACAVFSARRPFRSKVVLVV